MSLIASGIVGRIARTTIAATMIAFVAVVGAASYVDMRDLLEMRQSEISQRFSERLLGIRNSQSTSAENDPSVAAAVLSHEHDLTLAERGLFIPPSAKLRRMAYQALFAQREERAVVLQGKSPKSFQGDADGGFFVDIDRDAISVFSVNVNAFEHESNNMRRWQADSGLIWHEQLLNNGAGVIFSKAVEGQPENVIYHWDFASPNSEPEFLTSVTDGEIYGLESGPNGDLFFVEIERVAPYGEGENQKNVSGTQFEFRQVETGEMVFAVPSEVDYTTIGFHDFEERNVFFRAFSDDSARAAFRLTEGKNNAIGVWSIETGELIHHRMLGEKVPLALAFLPEDDGLIIGYADGSISFFSEDLRVERPISLPKKADEVNGSPVRQIVVLYDGSVLATAQEDGHISMWRRDVSTDSSVTAPSPRRDETALSGDEETFLREVSYELVEQFDFKKNVDGRVFLQALGGILRATDYVSPRAYMILPDGKARLSVESQRLVNDGNLRILSTLVSDNIGNIKLVTSQAAPDLSTLTGEASKTPDTIANGGAKAASKFTLFRVYATNSRQDVLHLSPSPGQAFIADIAVGESRAIVAELDFDADHVVTRVFSIFRNDAHSKRSQVLELAGHGAISMIASGDLQTIYLGLKGSVDDEKQSVLALSWNSDASALIEKWRTQIEFDPIKLALSPDGRTLGAGGDGYVQLLEAQNGAPIFFPEAEEDLEPRTLFGGSAEAGQSLIPHISFVQNGRYAAFNYDGNRGAIVSLHDNKCVIPIGGIGPSSDDDIEQKQGSASGDEDVNNDDTDKNARNESSAGAEKQPIAGRFGIGLVYAVALDPKAPRITVAHASDEQDKKGRIDILRYDGKACALDRVVRADVQIRGAHSATLRAGEATPARLRYSPDSRTLFAADGKGALAAFAPNGRARWRAEPGRFASHDEVRSALFDRSAHIYSGGVNITTRSDGLAAYLTGRGDTALIDHRTGELLFTVPEIDRYQLSTTLSGFEFQGNHLVLSGVERGMVWWDPPSPDEVVTRLQQQQDGIRECLEPPLRAYHTRLFGEAALSLKRVLRSPGEAVDWVREEMGLEKPEPFDLCPSATVLVKVNSSAQSGDVRQ